MNVRRSAAVLAAVMLAGLCACGRVTGDSAGNNENKKSAVSAVESSQTQSQQEKTEESSQAEDALQEKSVVLDSFTEDNGAFVSVKMSGLTSDRLALAQYSSNVLHNGVVGKVGVPFVAMFDTLENGKLTVTVDRDNINDVPLRNLILLYYNEEDNNYEEIWCDADEENNSVTANITHDGVYVLTDWYQWGAAWGVDVSDYAYAHDDVHYGDTIGERTRLPFSVVIPYTYDGFDHEENYPMDKYDFDVFYRIVGNVAYGNVDIAYVKPKETMKAEDFYELMKTSLTKDFNWWEEVKSQENVTSADGTEGIKFVVSHKYVSGDDTYTIDDDIVFFPDDSGNYFCIIFNYSEKSEYAQTYEKILSSFTVKH